jgi:hypothetical protein
MAILDWKKQLGVYTARNQHQTSVPDPERDLDAANKQYVDNAIQAVYPVGALYISTLSTNPATLLGFGTWAAWGAGRMIVGRSSTDADFDTAEETGGSKTSSALIAHTHTVNPPNTTSSGISANHTHSGTTGGQSQSHNHSYTNLINGSYNGANGDLGTGLAGSNAGRTTGDASQDHTHSFTTGNVSSDHTHTVDIAQFDSGSAGSGSSFSIMNPYIVAYLWKRTA